MLTISNGVTFKGLKSQGGVFLFLIGIAGLVFAITQLDIINILIFLPISFFGLVFFLSIKGVEIDKKRNTVRPYFDFLLFKTGKTEILDANTSVVIGFFQGTHASSVSPVGPIANARRIISYDVYLDGAKKILLKECPRYEIAIQTAKEVADHLGCEIHDKIPEVYRRRRRS